MWLVKNSDFYCLSDNLSNSTVCIDREPLDGRLSLVVCTVINNSNEYESGPISHSHNKVRLSFNSQADPEDESGFIHLSQGPV